jgi:hypothetical protein
VRFRETLHWSWHRRRKTPRCRQHP